MCGEEGVWVIYISSSQFCYGSKTALEGGLFGGKEVFICVSGCLRSGAGQWYLSQTHLQYK